MNWSKKAWNNIEGLYASILQMPFILELSDGTLPKEKFGFYMAQDAIYLEHFGRTLALIGTKAPDLKHALSFISFAQSTFIVESALHESYFTDFGISERGISEPACHHYTHFLRSTAAIEPVEVAMAAVLPCFWIYQKVGEHIFKNHKIGNNPYEKWIATYSSEEFAKSVDSAIAICDSIASTKLEGRMIEAFVTSSRLEFEFWDAAYKLRRWG
ncbi:MAG: thiaminase II [Chitinophagaceae bacterium]|nr:MAG: thiaminase II [Chitinophagaceae bacterium]